MDDINANNLTSNIDKQYGIHRIFKFAKKKQGKLYITQKKELVNLESTTKATVVKVEFTNTNCFILLSNGVVMSKGKDECLGRDSEEKEGGSKKFGLVSFINQSKDFDEGTSQNAVIYNISAGDDFVLALDYHYNVWAWGSNAYLQLSPKITNSSVRRPVRIPLPSDAKVVQIFALQRSSMTVCKKNIIYMWGCISEGYLGFFKKEKGENYVKEYIKMDKISTFIVNDIKRNDESYTEAFINSRKLFNTKYNVTLEDNSNKIERIEKLNTQIRNLKSDIEMRQKQNNHLLSSLTAKSTDKRITLLQDLLKIYEEKLNKISLKKDNLRKELITVEEEINQKDIDHRGCTEQIDVVEDKIESLNNEITELKSSLAEDEEKNAKTHKIIAEKSKALYSQKVYKESLMTNLQVIIIFLEEKEILRKKLANSITEFTEKENIHLKARYTVEDMIHILQESLTSNHLVIDNNLNSVMTSSNEKYKEKYIELFKLHDKLESLTFTSLNKAYPYKLIDDILEQSNYEIKQITKELETTKSSLSEMIKESLQIIFDMLDTKIELIKEQNAMIRNLYNVFNSYEKTDLRGLSSNQGGNNVDKTIKFLQNFDPGRKDLGRNVIMSNESQIVYSTGNRIEDLHKELILKFLDTANKGNKSEMKESTSELERKVVEAQNYKTDKAKQVNTLLKRNAMYEKVEKEMDFSDIISFGYSKTDSKSGSSFTWGGFFGK